MAETREIVITIKEKPDKQNIDTSNITTSNVSKIDNSNISTTTSVLLNQALESAKQDINRIVSYEIQKNFNLTDNYIGERYLNNAKQVVSRASKIGVSIATGFATGGIVGAIVVAGLEAISLGIDTYQNQENQNIKLKQNDLQLSFSRQRSGYSLISNSIGENK